MLEIHELPAHVTKQIGLIGPRLNTTNKAQADIKLCQGGGKHYHIVLLVEKCSEGIIHLKHKHGEDVHILEKQPFTTTDHKKPIQSRLPAFQKITTIKPKSIHISDWVISSNS